MGNETLFQGRSPEEIIAIVRDNCDKSEQKRYFRPLTQEEYDNRLNILAESAIQSSDLQEKRKEVTKQFDDQLKALKQQSAIILTEIKTRQIEEEGTFYYMANHDSGMMEVYDSHGNLNHTRRLNPDERQTKIPLMRAAN